jgi:hypothetical protein
LASHRPESGQGDARDSYLNEEIMADRQIPLLESEKSPRPGKVGWILLWLLGVPIPVLLILFLIRGCT